MAARLSEDWGFISHTVVDQRDHLLVLELNHILNSSVAVVDIHSAHLRRGAETNVKSFSRHHSYT